MPDLSTVQIRRAMVLPPERAVAYLESLGVEVTWDWREQLDVLRRRAFTIAKVTSASLLQTFLDELKSGMKKGTPWKEWTKQTGELLQQKGYARRPDGSAWRLDNIYRTNLQSAYQAGRYQQMKSAGRFEFWQYRAVGDKRSRPKHAELDGLILPKSHPFWKRVFPPNGFRCRCTVTALTRKQAIAAGYREPTGSKAVTPDGRVVDLGDWQPDPGFAGVPGQPYEPDVEQFDPAIGKQLKLELEDE